MQGTKFPPDIENHSERASDQFPVLSAADNFAAILTKNALKRGLSFRLFGALGGKYLDAL